MSLTVYLESLGCSKNQVDAEIMLGVLNKCGYKSVDNRDGADVIIVNTCGFIEEAKEESINKIIELGQLKNKSLKALIVSGCLAERYASELLEELPEIDGILGTGNYKEIESIVNQSLQGNKGVRVGELNKIYDESLPRLYKPSAHSEYIKISDGCNNFCTYCIIPKLRGRYRSRTIEGIINEAKILAQKGVREIVLIAQDTTRYGMDIYNEYMLPNLLEELNKIDRIEWIRLLYCYPEMITDELIDKIANLDKVCKYLDIPIQHCNDRILKEMNRKTNKENIIELIKKLRSKIPDLVIRTTLIVGFPGETSEEYLELFDFVKKMQFDKLGVFKYSQEEDTPAARMPFQVSEDIKLRRQQQIMQAQQNISLDLNILRIGKVVEVMIEEKLGNSDEYLGRTKGDAPEIDGFVYVKSKAGLNIGDIVSVKISNALEYDLIGEKVDEFSE